MPQQGLTISWHKLLAGIFALVVAVAGGTYAVIKIAVEHGGPVTPIKREEYGKISNGVPEEKIFLKSQLKLIGNILSNQELKYSVGESAIQLIFASENQPDIYVIIKPKFGSRSIYIGMPTRVYINPDKMSTALEWINEANRKNIYGRYYVDQKRGVIFDWALRTTDEGPEPQMLMVPILAMESTLREDYSSISSFGEIKKIQE